MTQVCRVTHCIAGVVNRANIHAMNEISTYTK